MNFTPAKHTWRLEAVDERIAREIVRAVANWAVVYNFALSVAAASADAGIYAFLIHARSVGSTFRIY